MNQTQIVSVVLQDANGSEINIGTAEIEIDLLEKTAISEKEKVITLKKIHIPQEGEVIFNSGGWTLNTFLEHKTSLEKHKKEIKDFDNKLKKRRE